jgi:hypothetical protein
VASDVLVELALEEPEQVVLLLVLILVSVEGQVIHREQVVFYYEACVAHPFFLLVYNNGESGGQKPAPASISREGPFILPAVSRCCRVLSACVCCFRAFATSFGGFGSLGGDFGRFGFGCPGCCACPACPGIPPAPGAGDPAAGFPFGVALDGDEPDALPFTFDALACSSAEDVSM